MRLPDLIYASTGLTVDQHTFASDPDGQILVASLMALVAKSDGGISPDEILRMVQMLRVRFHLKPGEALNLVTRASDQLADADLDELLDEVNKALTLSNKEELMVMVLNVIAADNKKDAEEMKLLAALIDGLKIPHSSMESVYTLYFEEKRGSERT